MIKQIVIQETFKDLLDAFHFMEVTIREYESTGFTVNPSSGVQLVEPNEYVVFVSFLKDPKKEKMAGVIEQLEMMISDIPEFDDV